MQFMIKNFTSATLLDGRLCGINLIKAGVVDQSQLNSLS